MGPYNPKGGGHVEISSCTCPWDTKKIALDEMERHIKFGDLRSTQGKVESIIWSEKCFSTISKWKEQS